MRLFNVQLHSITRFGIGLTVLLTFVIAGCSGGTTTNTTTSVKSATLSSISITPASATISKGKTAMLTAVGTFSDGSIADISSTVTWSGADPAIAMVDRGIATGTTVGTTTVTAVLNGVVSPTADVTVTDAVLTGISIAPAAVSAPKGTTTVFTAIGAYSDGTSGNISGSVTWASSNIAVATVNASGIATGLSLGTTSLTASLNGITSNISTLNVTAPVLTGIAITPVSVTLAKGQTANMVATGIYSDGSTAAITDIVSWTAADPSTATVGNTTGIVTGVATGGSAVTAYSNGVSSPAAPVTVTPAALTGITVTPDNFSMPVGIGAVFTATGTFTDGTTGNISGSVIWTYGNPPVVTDHGVGLVTGAMIGSTSVSASMSGVTSNTASLQVTRHVVTSITSIASLSGPTVAVGSYIYLTASGNYSDGLAWSSFSLEAPATWSSFDPAKATVSSAGRVTGVEVGTTMISVTADGAAYSIPVVVTP